MQLSTTQMWIIGGVLAIMLFIWYMNSKKAYVMEQFQTMGGMGTETSEDGITVLSLPPEQCEKMQGMRTTILSQIDIAKNNGNTGARKSYEHALKVLEDTMNISRCDMTKTPSTVEEAVSEAIAPATA